MGIKELIEQVEIDPYSVVEEMDTLDKGSARRTALLLSAAVSFQQDNKNAALRDLESAMVKPTLGVLGFYLRVLNSWGYHNKVIEEFGHYSNGTKEKIDVNEGRDPVVEALYQVGIAHVYGKKDYDKGLLVFEARQSLRPNALTTMDVVEVLALRNDPGDVERAMKLVGDVGSMLDSEMSHGVTYRSLSPQEAIKKHIQTGFQQDSFEVFKDNGDYVKEFKAILTKVGLP